MKRIVKAGFILVFMAFLYNLITIVSASGYWSESGAAMKETNVDTDFGDWEYFYHEPFTDRAPANPFWFAYERSDGVSINSTGRIIGQNNSNHIEGRTLLLAPINNNDRWESTKTFQIVFPRGLGGFSFDYKNVGDIGEKLYIDVRGEDEQAELFSEEIIFTDTNVVKNIRYDFNVDSSNSKVTLTMTTQANARVAIDNIKWSDHNIKVEFLDGYNTNENLATKYIRYGRTALEYEEELKNLKKGYELIGWYTDPSLAEEYKYDFQTPVRKSLTLYSNWQIIFYNIEYDLNGGYFEPFDDRDEMIVEFLTDFYNYLVDNDLLTGTDFHQWLMNEGFANEEISLNDFIYGTGFDASDPKIGKYGGIYDGLFLKGFVPVEPEVGENFAISFDLNGGTFPNTGTTSYPKNLAGRQDMIKDFLTDFYNFVDPADVSLNEFMHGKGKSSGFDGTYNQSLNKLYAVNNKTINPSTGKFVNQPEYNKWVLLIDLMDEYAAFSSGQSFWGSLYTANLRFKPFILRNNLWTTYLKNAEVRAVTDRIPDGIKKGGTAPNIPTEYEGGTEVTLPIPARYDGKTFNGWYEYNYKTKKFVGPVTKITTSTLGNKDYYAFWSSSPNPTPKPESPLGIKLRKDSYYNQLYEMSALYTDETETEYNKDFSDLAEILAIDPSRPYFINQPQYNKWQHLLDLIHNYTTFGNTAQWFGIWKSYYTGAIRMEMFFQQYNPWPSQESEERYAVFEMLRRIPYNIPKELIPYRYTIEDDLIILPRPIKEHVDDQAQYAGWLEYDFETGTYFEDVVDRIDVRSTGDKKFFSRFFEKKFTIEYELNGGKFAPYAKRDDLINDFLDDFYDFVKEKLNSEFEGISRNTFKHGAGKTSGFKGIYTDYIYYSSKKELIPVQLLFATDDKSVNPRTGRFINQEDYNDRWLPLLELAADFTTAINSKDDFWNSPKLAAERLKQLFSKDKPPLAPSGIDGYFSIIPTNISKVKVPKYYVNDTVTHLPEAVLDGKRFIGWYTDEAFTETAWESIPIGTRQNMTLYAKWYDEGLYEVTYEFGLYGYHGTTRTDYFRWFISDYINEFKLELTEEALYDDFFNNSKVQVAEGLTPFEDLFTYKNARWAWIKDYVISVVGEDYEHLAELIAYDQVIWRLNIDALFNSTQIVLTEDINEGEQKITSSGDFSSLISANGFWEKTPYNKYEIALVPGGDLYPSEFVNGWHPGYRFAGWYLDNETYLNKLTKLPEDPTGDITLYAKWEDIFNGEVVVIFVDYDGTILETKEVPADGYLIDVPLAPERPYYAFLGWYDGFTKVDFNNKITESLIVKAAYESETYTLTFETSGGTAIDEQQLTYPDLPEKPLDPERVGFTFAGWYTNETYQNEFFFEFPLYENTTVYAKWDPVSYNINYHLNGGEFVTNNGTNPTSYTILDIITISLASKENHQFIGWYLSEDFSGEIITVIENMSGDLNLYAKYEINQYKVSFDNNNGDEITSVIINHGEKVTKPLVNPVKVGSTFDVWTLEDMDFDFNTPITEDITLIARYDIEQFTVIYEDSLGRVLTQEIIDYGYFAVIPQVPIKEGYSGVWETDLTNIPIINDYRIKPIYSAIEYTIYYHLNGGVNGPNPLTYNKAQTIILKDATKDGYSFTGWYLNMDLSGDAISVIENMSGNLNLYAAYSLNTYSITYENVLDATHTNPITYNIYDVIILEDAFKDGYFFKGWYLDETFTEEIEVIANKFENLTIYANFSNLIDYEITYVLYPNLVEPNDPAIFNQTINKYNTDQEVTLENPSDRVSSLFKGWYDNDEFTGEPVTKIPQNSTGDKTFYAKWELKNYTIKLYDSKNDMINDLQPYKIICTIPHSSIISLDDYDRNITEGYEFIGWHYLLGETPVLFDQEQQINASYKLYPEFGLKQYKVTFIVDSTTNYQYLVYHNELLPNIPEDPIIAGNEFIGWYLEDGITIFNENDPITRDLVILAKWSDDGLYKVTFLNEDGTFIRVLNVNAGGLVLEPTEKPTKEGFNFLGWYLNGDKFIFTTPINANLTLRAKFEVNSYTITFESNGGTPIAPITREFGTGINAPVAPNKVGHTFNGWYSDISLLTPYVFKTMPADHITLYAKWNTNNYQVRFFDYNNSLIISLNVEHGSNITALAPINLVREHYNHTGWDKDLTNITGNTDIMAVYEGKVYRITFNSDGGTNVPYQDIIYPNRAIKPANPTKEGYTFAGWRNGINETEFNFNSILVSDITVTATWESASVTVTFDYKYDDLITEVPVIKGQKVTKPDDPVRSNYEFIGWYDQTTDLLFSFDDLIYENKTLIAKYLKIHTVTYVDEHGGQIKEILVVDGKTIDIIDINEISGLLSDVQKNGYSVVWDQDLTNFIIKNDVEVKPQYTAIEYTIIYANVLPGAVNSNKTKYKITDSTFTLLTPTNIPVGNTFAGWYLNDLIIDEITQGTYGNKTIYAKWSLVDYSITYNLNGGKFFNFDTRDQMITAFLTDFHTFLKLSISVNDFIHGAGKSSGYDGSYADYIELLREINDKTINPETNKFVNQAVYNKWVPLIDLMDEYTGINPDQVGQFWGSNWTAGLRFKPFIQKLNIWPNDNKEAEVAEIVNKIPNEYNYSVSYQYNLESGTVNLPTPMKDNHEFIGWYTANTGGTKVTAITEGTTGNQTFYARWNIAQYSIIYSLQGGVFSVYNTKVDMTHGFLQDLYDFVNATEDLNTFMHGAGKTSGFNGTWYSNSAYKDKIYTIGKPTKVNEAYFASSSKYMNKWMPFFEMMDVFVKVGNPDQSFWSSPYTGNLRMNQYFRNVKPGASWTDTNMEMMPSPLVKVTPITSYQEGNREIILPIPTRSNYYFQGWYTNPSYTGSPVIKIVKNSTGDKTYYAKWQVVISSGNIEKKLLTQSECYYRNVKRDPGFPRSKTTGIIIHSVGASGVSAANLFTTWNTMSSRIALHAVIDDKKIYQYLEWDFRAYHTANVGNAEYVGIMFAENSGYTYTSSGITGYNVSAQEAYFNAAWNNAVNLTVFLLKFYSITNVNEYTVVGRHDAKALGIAINDVASPGLLFNQHNKTMSDFRADVRARM